MSRPVLLLSCFLVVALQSLSPTASPQSPASSVDSYAYIFESRMCQRSASTLIYLIEYYVSPLRNSSQSLELKLSR